ncbi:MAG: chromate resistance protein [Actinobacteria bacterium]|nr:MAG: chromate resistance protein [Actinomycetota bacterium]
MMLAYRLPREPSSPRVVVWRRLRRLGAAVLPADARTREQFDWLAEQVVDAGGEATTWVARAGSARQERELARRMADEAARDYRAVIADAAAAAGDLGTAGRTLARLRRELHRIAQRDHFPPRERDAARHSVARLADQLATGEEAKVR